MYERPFQVSLHMNVLHSRAVANVGTVVALPHLECSFIPRFENIDFFFFGMPDSILRKRACLKNRNNGNETKMQANLLADYALQCSHAPTSIYLTAQPCLFKNSLGQGGIFHDYNRSYAYLSYHEIIP